MVGEELGGSKKVHTEIGISRWRQCLNYEGVDYANDMLIKERMVYLLENGPGQCVR